MVFKISKYILIIITVLITLPAISLVYLKYIDLNQFKNAIESEVSKLTGRQLRIEGDLRFDLSLHPSISIEKLHFSNSSWSNRPESLSLENLQLQIELTPLLKRILVVEELLINGVTLIVENNDEGKSNWQLFNPEVTDNPDDITTSKSGSTSSSLPLAPVFKKILLDDINIYYADDKTEIESNIDIENLTLTNHAINKPFTFYANGAVNKNPFRITGKTSIHSPALDTNDKESLTINLDVTAVGASLTAEGEITQPVKDNGIDINTTLEIKDLEKTFFAITGKSLKAYAIKTSQPLPLTAVTRLTNKKGYFELRNTKVKLANSDIDGDISFVDRGGRHLITANIQSDKIDINRIYDPGTINKSTRDQTPGNRSDKNSADSTQAETALDTGFLNALDASINYSIGQVHIDHFTADTIALTGKIKSGNLSVDQLDFNLANATLRSSLSVNNKKRLTDDLIIKTKIELKNLDIKPFTKRYNISSLKKGRLNALIDLEARGTDINAILRDMHGRSNIALSQVIAEHEIDGRSHEIYIQDLNVAYTAMDSPVTCNMEGRIDEEKILVNGQLLTPGHQLDKKKSKLSIRIDALQSTLTATSMISTPVNLKMIAIDTRLNIPQPGTTLGKIHQLYPKIHTIKNLPELPVSLATRLKISDKNFHAGNLKISLGPNDLQGDISIDIDGKKPVITADLSSNLIDLDSIRSKKITTAETESKPESRPGLDKLFSTEPLPTLQGLDLLNAKIHYNLEKLNANDQHIKNISLDMALENGELSIRPLTMHFAEGTIETNMMLSQDKNLQIKTSTSIENLDYGRLQAMFKQPEYANGELDATISLTSSGDSISKLMAGLNGTIRVTTENGNMNSRTIRLLSKDLSSLIPFTDKSDRQKIRCAVVQFDINEGIARSHALVLDTGTVSALGSGVINLADETISLYISPRTRRTSVMKLALVPLNVSGPLSSPSITPDAAGTTARTTNTAAHIGLAVATSGISLVAEGLTDELWKQFIDDTDYCKLALAGERVVPTLIKIKESAQESPTQDGEKNKDDPEYIEELEDDDDYF